MILIAGVVLLMRDRASPCPVAIIDSEHIAFFTLSSQNL